MASAAAKKILIVEDEHDILQLVKLYLEKEGFRTVTATTGAEGLNRAKQDKPDLIVLDLMLPEIDGLEVCKRLRSAPETAMLPIIMLTAKAEESDQVIGLELGADDYVTKPFSPKAFVARVKALFRRLDRSRQESRTVYQYGKLSMDLSRHEVTVQGKDVPLTAKEFGLLEHLLRNPGTGPDERSTLESGLGIRLLRDNQNGRCARAAAEAENSPPRRRHRLNQIARLQIKRP